MIDNVINLEQLCTWHNYYIAQLKCAMIHIHHSYTIKMRLFNFSWNWSLHELNGEANHLAVCQRRVYVLNGVLTLNSLMWTWSQLKHILSEVCTDPYPSQLSNQLRLINYSWKWSLLQERGYHLEVCLRCVYVCWRLFLTLHSLVHAWT